MKDKVLILAKTSDYSETGFYKMNRYVLTSYVLASDFKILNFNLISKRAGGFLKLFRLFKDVLRLIKTILQFKPQLVYFTISPHKAFYRDLFYVIVLKTFSKAKIVYHLHGKGIKDKSASKINKALYSYAYKNVYVISLSELLAFDFKALPIKSYYVLGNAIEMNIPQTPQSKDNPIPQILFLSNFIQSKGLLVLIEALALVKSNDIAFTCKLTGQEDDLSFKDIKDKLQEFNLEDCVTITGPKYASEKTRLLLESDIFVHPTLEDVWGLVILEAMEAELPVISTNEGAIPEIIVDGKSGFVVDKNNAQMLADKITLLLNDVELRKNMGKSGRERFINNYLLKDYDPKLASIFNSILND